LSPTKSFLVAAIAAVAACSKSSTSNGPTPDHIGVAPAFASLSINATQQLVATVYDASDNVIADAPVTYRSADTTIAKVSSTGLVTGVATGLTTVTVRSAPASATVPVAVSGVKDLYVIPDSTLLVGAQTLQLVVTAYDSLGNLVPTPPVTYVSRDTAALTVSSAGLVTRHGVGSAYVVAVSGQARDSVIVTALRARVRVSTSGRTYGAAIFSATRGYVTLVDESAVQQVNLTTPSTVGLPVVVGSLPSCVAVNAAGTRAYVGSQNGDGVTVLNTATNSVAGTIRVSGNVLVLQVTPGDSLLLVGTDYGQLYIARLATSTVVDSVAVPTTLGLAMRGDTTVFASEVFSGAVAEINLRTRQVVRTLSVGNRPEDLVVSTDGHTLYVANEYAGQVQYWDLATGTMAGSTDLPGWGGFGMARDPATGLLYVSTSYFGSRVHVIDPATRQIVRFILTGHTPRRIAFTADGSAGIVANEGGWVDYIK